jgi:hypothetical protein
MLNYQRVIILIGPNANWIFNTYGREVNQKKQSATVGFSCSSSSFKGLMATR